MSTSAIKQHERHVMSRFSESGLYRPDIHGRDGLYYADKDLLLEFEMKTSLLLRSMPKGELEQIRVGDFGSESMREIYQHVVKKKPVASLPTVSWTKEEMLMLPFIIESVVDGSKLHLWHKNGELLALTTLPELSGYADSSDQLCTVDHQGKIVKYALSAIKKRGYSPYPLDKKGRVLSALVKKAGNDKLSAVSLGYYKVIGPKVKKRVNDKALFAKLSNFSKKNNEKTCGILLKYRNHTK